MGSTTKRADGMTPAAFALMWIGDVLRFVRLEDAAMWFYVRAAWFVDYDAEGPGRG